MLGGARTFLCWGLCELCAQMRGEALPLGGTAPRDRPGLPSEATSPFRASPCPPGPSPQSICLHSPLPYSREGPECSGITPVSVLSDDPWLCAQASLRVDSWLCAQGSFLALLGVGLGSPGQWLSHSPLSLSLPPGFFQNWEGRWRVGTWLGRLAGRTGGVAGRGAGRGADLSPQECRLQQQAWAALEGGRRGNGGPGQVGAAASAGNSPPHTHTWNT